MNKRKTTAPVDVNTAAPAGDGDDIEEKNVHKKSKPNEDKCGAEREAKRQTIIEAMKKWPKDFKDGVTAEVLRDFMDFSKKKCASESQDGKWPNGYTWPWEALDKDVQTATRSAAFHYTSGLISDADAADNDDNDEGEGSDSRSGSSSSSSSGGSSGSDEGSDPASGSADDEEEGEGADVEEITKPPKTAPKTQNKKSTKK